MENELNVRVGTPEDVDGMMQLALAACEENGLTNPNPSKLLNEIWAGLTRQYGIVGIIGRSGEQFEAAILLRTEPLWYSDDLTIVERAIFVHPDFRSAKGVEQENFANLRNKPQRFFRSHLLLEFLVLNESKEKFDFMKDSLVLNRGLIGFMAEEQASGKMNPWPTRI